MAKRRKFTDQFKAKVALEALRGDKTEQEAIFKRTRTSLPHPQHPVFPYLLRKIQIDRPNQVPLSGSCCA